MACFTDQENDPESGLMYYGARYYDPWVGRFLSQDPDLVGPFAGPSFARIGVDPQQFNSYSYARNSPTRYTDPTGSRVELYLHWQGENGTIGSGGGSSGGSGLGSSGSGKLGGSGRGKVADNSAGVAATGASFGDSPTTETISVPPVETEAGQVTRFNEKGVIGPVYVTIQSGKEGADVEVNAKESNLTGGNSKMPVSVEVGENQIRGRMTMDAGQS